jgi:hypothetical protein
LTWHRVFERLGAARLCAIDLRAADAVELAFGGEIASESWHDGIRTGERPA